MMDINGSIADFKDHAPGHSNGEQAAPATETEELDEMDFLIYSDSDELGDDLAVGKLGKPTEEVKNGVVKPVIEKGTFLIYRIFQVIYRNLVISYFVNIKTLNFRWICKWSGRCTAKG